jgi:hypothetical protein
LRGFLFGLVVVPLLVISVLSIRPGGLRRQLKNVFRRLRLVLVLGGVYFVGSGVVRLVFGSQPYTEYAIGALALVLGIIFVILGQDRALES